MLSLPTKEGQAVSEFFQYVWTCSDSIGAPPHSRWLSAHLQNSRSDGEKGGGSPNLEAPRNAHVRSYFAIPRLPGW